MHASTPVNRGSSDTRHFLFLVLVPSTCTGSIDTVNEMTVDSALARGLPSGRCACVRRGATVMNIDEARQLLQQALTRVPSLTPDGGVRLPRSSMQWSDREQLQIAACADWLTAFATTRKTINDHWTSYGLKHLVEDSTQAHDIDHYVCNGAFIAAAVAFGYRFACVELNMRFAMRLDRLAAPRIRTGREQLCTPCRHKAQERHRLGRALGMTL